MPNGGLRSSVKTNECGRLPTQRISVVKHVQDPDEISSTSESGAEDNGIFCESVDCHLSIITLD